MEEVHIEKQENINNNNEIQINENKEETINENNEKENIDNTNEIKINEEINKEKENTDNTNENKINEEHVDENENNNKENSNQNQDEEEISKMVRVNDFETNHDFIFRICIIGDCAVGKTSLLTRFCDNTFKESYNNTIGVDFRVITLKYQNYILKLHLWDTAGQERFKSIALNYFRSSHGFIFVYDISEANTFNNVKKWMDLAFSNSKNVGINFLVGNKNDLEESRKVQKADAAKFAKEKKLIYFETSAKTNENVEKVFIYFTYKLFKYFSENKDEYSSNDESKTRLMSNVKNIEIPNKEEKKCAC
jgi:Ras-related protein Rab-1A